MPYLPPAGLAVNVVRDQAAYSPPPGIHVDFHGYTEASYVLTGNGKVRFDGGMDTYSVPVGLGGGVLTLVGEAVTGSGSAAALAGEFTFLGVIDAEVVIPTITAAGQINWGDSISVTVVVNSVCAGEIMWDGEIDLFTRPPQIDIECSGSLPMFVGSADVRRGENAACSGRFSLRGSANARVGRVGNMAGRLILAGAAQAKRGESAFMAGALLLSGEAIVRLDRQVECAMSGTIVFSGAAYLQLQVSAIESMDVVFVSSRQERISVLQ